MKVFSRPGKRDNWSRQSFALLTLGLVLMPIDKKSMISLNENHIIVSKMPLHIVYVPLSLSCFITY